MRFVLLHIPHILPAIMAAVVLVRFGISASHQPPAHLDDEQVAEWWRVQEERTVARRVRRTTSLIGLWSLVPLLLAVGTGLALYTLALRDDRPSAALVWSHTVVSVLALALATWKVVELGGRRLRRGLVPRRFFLEGLSLLLTVLAMPLLLTGIVLLASPSSGSYAAYVHLVVAVWWMVVLGVHLVRYLGRSLDAALRDRAAPDQPAPRPAPRATFPG